MAIKTLLDLRDTLNEAIVQYGENERLQPELDAANDRIGTLTKIVAARDETIEAQLRALDMALTEIERLRAELAALQLPPSAFTRPALTVDANDARLRQLHTIAPPTQGNIGLPEHLGLGLKPYHDALMFGYLASGDPALIDKLALVMRAVKPAIEAQPAFGLGIHETSACALIAKHALVLKQHGRADWQTWLDLWQRRYGGRVMDDNLTHPYGASIETYAYLHLLTGEEQYAAERDRRIGVFKAHMTLDVNGWLNYNQRMPIMGNAILTDGGANFVELNYVRYTLATVLNLHELGYDLLDPQLLADSIAANCFRADGKIGFYLDGSLRGADGCPHPTTGREYDAAKWSISALSLLGRWNAKIAAHVTALTAAARNPSAWFAAAGLWWEMKA